jgi:pimeloyl-ACP methyl ester carboxylesterase
MDDSDAPVPVPATVTRSRLRRWLRRTGLGLLALVVMVTAFCWVYNAATARRAGLPAGLRFVPTADTQTRYRQWGTSGPAVVLVHGAAESADTWARVGPLLASGHRVYALDLIGWGYTRRVGRPDLDHQVRQLLAFLDALGLDRPVLAAHSSGAAVVAEATLRAPGRVGGLLFLDGDALATGAGQRSPARYLAIDPYRTTILRLAVRSDTVIRAVYDRQCGPRCPRLGAADLDAWRRPFQVPGAEAALWQLLDLGVPGLSVPRLRQLATVAVPKRVVFGAADSVFSTDTPAQTADRIGAPAPTLIPAARHLTMISDPDRVASAVSSLTGG